MNIDAVKVDFNVDVDMDLWTSGCCIDSDEVDG